MKILPENPAALTNEEEAFTDRVSPEASPRIILSRAANVVVVALVVVEFTIERLMIVEDADPPKMPPATVSPPADTTRPFCTVSPAVSVDVAVTVSSSVEASPIQELPITPSRVSVVEPVR